jgi:pimeloyl-ACP methyl ester carboxylesterase
VSTGGKRIVYIPGIAGDCGLPPALDDLPIGDAPAEVVRLVPPGLDGASGFVAPHEYIDWLVRVWDRFDAIGAAPCPVIGASVGGMLAAELAILRPEAVTALVLFAPFGFACADEPGVDPWELVTEGERVSQYVAGEVPAAVSDRYAALEPVEREVSLHTVNVAAASLLWPLGDRGIDARWHRIGCPTLVVWGEEDRVNPVSRLARWPGLHVRVPDAGHMVEWDAPTAVRDAVSSFLGTIDVARR